MMFSRLLRVSSNSVSASMMMRPRPVVYVSTIPFRPRTLAPVGKSGPVTCRISRSVLASGWSIRYTMASHTSPRLCGGMFVAIPTAMPDAPLTSIFGKTGRQHRRLRQRVVEVGRKVHRVLVNVRQQLVRTRRQPRLGVPHRRRGSPSMLPKLPCPAISG